MSSPVSTTAFRSMAPSSDLHGSSTWRPASVATRNRSACGNAMVFSVRPPWSSTRMNLTSTVSAWRNEMAVCIHLKRIWNLRPNGSGPASNWRKFCMRTYLTMATGTLIVLVAELISQRQFHLTEQSIEEPGPGEVQVRVGAVGICGSDLHSYAEGAVGDTACRYPMVLGHEPAGTVVKNRSGVPRG